MGSTYLNHQQLTQQLKEWSTQFPKLLQISEIGKSHEGREIWLATITDAATGPAADKPAFWADGNIHASELSASTAVLVLIEKLLNGFGSDENITYTLQSRAFYLVPRLNPDGAEWALESPPRIIRSSTRPYPYDEADPYGLERKDMDGDGRILSMRIPDPNGAWKIFPEEPRLMVRRGPTDRGEQFYRLIAEGEFENFDALKLRPKKLPQGLDMNRNFPNAWRQEHEQHGAGPFPASEPEIRAAVQAIVSRPNICLAITFHTFSGVHLRPPARYPDDTLPPEDIWNYDRLGAEGTKITGYPAISNYHEFRYHPKEVITGTFDDWMFEHRGAFCWTTEIWSPQRQAGITDYKYIDWFRDHPVADDLALLKWSDEKLDGLGHIDWKPFDHPQLGQVEIGGWDGNYAFRNPPPNYLLAEVSPLADWAIWLAQCSPKLELHSVTVEGLKIRVAVHNTGYLPTQVTELAKKNRLFRGVAAEISPVDKLVLGDIRQIAGQLVGRSHVAASGFGWQFDSTEDRAVFEWVVKEPGSYEVVVSHERAGRISVTVQV